MRAYDLYYNGKGWTLCLYSNNVIVNVKNVRKAVEAVYILSLLGINTREEHSHLKGCIL